MNGRQWVNGAVSMRVSVYSQGLEKGISFIDYIGGIMDTLDGSHGVHFTYLPIVYQDDCQVCEMSWQLRSSADCRYSVEVRVLSNALEE